MKIIIVGATQVGIELAEYLVGAGHAITLVDSEHSALSQIADRLDLRVVQGEASWPSVLRKAGAENTELLVATTPNDEYNIAVCSVASSLFAVPRKIARIRSPEYLTEAQSLFNEHAIPIDHIISPEHITAGAVLDLLELSGTTAVGSFANKRVVIASAVCTRGGRLLGFPLENLCQADPKARVLALYRNHELVSDFKKEMLAEGDEVFFCAERSRVMSFLSSIVPLETGAKNITIAGGSHTADELARTLSARYRVKLIEPDPQRAARIFPRLMQYSSLELFCADPCDKEFMIEEHLDKSDRFIAASPNDEINIISSLMLKRLNNIKSIAVIRRSSLHDLSTSERDGQGADTVVSPREAVISALLSDIRQEGVLKMRLFRSGLSEGIELMVQGGRFSSRVVGRRIADLTLPPGVVLGMVLRDNKLLACTDDLKFEDGDRVIAYLHDHKQMRRLVALFKPRAFWIPRGRVWS